MKIENEEIAQTLKNLAQENEDLNQKFKNDMNLDLQKIMQLIYNHCPIMDHKDSKNIVDKFGLIGPINI